MYALINADNTFAQRFIGNSTDWRGVTLSNLAAMSVNERKTFGVYDFSYPVVRPTEFETSTGLEYDIDHAAGHVQEKFVIVKMPELEVEAKLIAACRAEVAKLCQPTDWEVTRGIEPGGKPCSAETLQYRADVRAAGNDYEARVLSALGAAAKIAVSAIWPKVPA